MRLETIWMDVRTAFRAMRKSPGFTAAAVLSLAFGIGATTAIFSVMDALIFRPLPVLDPQRLVLVHRGAGGAVLSYNMWKKLRERQDVFSGMFAYMPTEFDFAKPGEQRSIPGLYVNGDYFSTLGVSAVQGRTLLPSDDVRGAPLVCVISYGFWQRQYAKSPSVIGKTLSLSGQQFEVVGVTPPGFFGFDVGETFDVIVPLESERIIDAKQSAVNARSYWWALPSFGSVLDTDKWSLLVGGRLKPGIDGQRANARVRVLAPAIIQAGVPPGADEKLRQYALRAYLKATPMPNGMSLTRDLYGEAMELMIFMAGIVLVIACANLANLMHARFTARQRELATRLALGASRWRLVRQALTESIALSVIGAVLGLVIAHSGGKLLAFSICTSEGGPNGQYLYLPFDARFFWFPAMAAILSALLIGLGPGLRAAQMAPYLAMKSGPASLRTRRDSSRSLLIVAQVALSMTVLVGAGLLVRTIQKLLAQDLGYDPKGVLTVEAGLAVGDDSPERQAFIAHELLAEFRSIPGVVSAARYANTHSNSIRPNVIVQHPGGPEDHIMCVFVLTSSGYFETLHVPLFAGRDFTEEDSSVSTAVAIISETAARRFFPGINPLGLTFRQLDETGQQSTIKAVGIVKDVKELERSSGQPYPIIYRPIAQCSFPCPLFGTYQLRFLGPLSDITGRAKDAARSIDPHLALEFSLMSDTDMYHRERTSARLATLFGLLALVLAAIGIYGVTSYATAQRTNEIGLRMALGAQPRDVLRLIVGESLRVVLVGIALGALGAFGAVKLIREMLFGVSPADPLTFALTASLMVSMAVMAAFFPAYRALNTDPMSALRTD
jgi:putative ABC transport system permease protein